LIFQVEQTQAHQITTAIIDKQYTEQEIILKLWSMLN
jgi:hypothetical protein